MPVRGMRGSLRAFHYLRPTSLSRRLGFRRLNCPNPWRRFADTTVGLGMFGDRAQLLIDLREQRRDKLDGGGHSGKCPEI